MHDFPRTSALTTLENLLAKDEAARILGISVRTLEGWAARNEGPPAVRVGRLIRYSPSSLRQWILSRSTAGGAVHHFNQDR